MNSSTKPNLSIDVVSAVGPQIFSFLPLGSILNGFSSPLLVCKSFYDNIHLALAEFETLDFSQCAHLRKITDSHLISLIKNIVKISERTRPDDQGSEISRLIRSLTDSDSTCSRLRVKYLGLSRCRYIEGEGVLYCLSEMRGIERISLSMCASFDPEGVGFGLPNILSPKYVEYIDVSGCSKIGNKQATSLLTGLAGFAASRYSGRRLCQLDLSGCSTQIDDELVSTIPLFAPNLQGVNISGAKKVTELGLGILAWVRRDSLRKLNVCGCKVKLPILLYVECHNIATVLRDIDDPREAIPPNMIDGYNPNIGTHQCLNELKNATAEMISDHGDEVRLRCSADLMESIKSFGRRNGFVEFDNASSSIGLFGRLEELHIELRQHPHYKSQGCIAAIAWLNGGRLKTLKLVHSAPVSIHDLSVLHRMCGPRLKTFEIDAFVSFAFVRGSHVLQMPWSTGLRELDLSHSSVLGKHMGNLSFLSELHKLRMLKLDCLDVIEDGLHDYLSNTKTLLRLSVQHCSTIRCSNLLAAITANEDLKLLDLDAREINMDCLLLQLRQTCPSLLRLNNRSTEIGKCRTREHVRRERWRTGAKDNHIGPSAGQKRLRNGHIETNEDEDTDSFSNVCSLFHTGFSQKSDTEQEFFSCETCNIDFGRVICLTCVKKCHMSHKTKFVGLNSGYCDCCILSECLCMGV